MAGIATKSTGATRFPPPVAFLVGLAAGFLAQYFFPLSLVPAADALYLKLLGVLLIVVGIALAASAIRTFRRAGTTVRPDRASKALVTSGPFRFTRNPMYLSLSVVYMAVSFITDALWPLLFLIPAVAVIHYFVIPREERHLRSRFGAEYEAYVGSVRRWL